MAEAKKRKSRAKKKPPAKPRAEVEVVEEEEQHLSDKDSRNLDIWRAWMRGLDPATLAQTWNLSPRRIEEIIAAEKEKARVTYRAKAVDVIEEHILRVDGIVSELASVAAKEKGSARVSAIMGKLSALKERREVLQAIGVLPNDLGTLRIEMDTKRTVEAIIQIFDRHDVSSEAVGEVRALLVGGTGHEVTTEKKEKAAA